SINSCQLYLPVTSFLKIFSITNELLELKTQIALPSSSLYSLEGKDCLLYFSYTIIPHPLYVIYFVKTDNYTLIILYKTLIFFRHFLLLKIFVYMNIDL